MLLPYENSLTSPNSSANLLLTVSKFLFYYRNTPSTLSGQFSTFEAESYVDMIHWKDTVLTSSILRNVSSQQIYDYLSQDISPKLHIPKYPAHTQSVERIVQEVSKVSSQVSGFNARHGLIQNRILHRKEMQKLRIKADYKASNQDIHVSNGWEARKGRYAQSLRPFAPLLFQLLMFLRNAYVSTSNYFPLLFIILIALYQPVILLCHAYAQ